MSNGTCAKRSSQFQFDDQDKAEAEAVRTSILAKAQCSAAARRKALTKRTDDGLPIHSSRLLGDLATVNSMAITHQSDTTFVIYLQFTPTPGPSLRTPQRERQAVASKHDHEDPNP
jgi:hypothetical protein